MENKVREEDSMTDLSSITHFEIFYKDKKIFDLEDDLFIHHCVETDDALYLYVMDRLEAYDRAELAQVVRQFWKIDFNGNVVWKKDIKALGDAKWPDVNGQIYVTEKYLFMFYDYCKIVINPHNGDCENIFDVKDWSQYVMNVSSEKHFSIKIKSKLFLSNELLSECEDFYFYHFNWRTDNFVRIALYSPYYLRNTGRDLEIDINDPSCRVAYNLDDDWEIKNHCKFSCKDFDFEIPDGLITDIAHHDSFYYIALKRCKGDVNNILKIDSEGNLVQKFSACGYPSLGNSCKFLNGRLVIGPPKIYFYVNEETGFLSDAVIDEDPEWDEIEEFKDYTIKNESELWFRGRKIYSRNDAIIQQALLFHGYIYVVFIPVSGSDYYAMERNIHKIDLDGNIIWTSMPKDPWDGEDIGLISNNYFIYVEKGKLTSFASPGVPSNVDEETGIVTSNVTDGSYW